MEGTSAGAMRKALKAERGAGGSGKAVLILLSGGQKYPITRPAHDVPRRGGIVAIQVKTLALAAMRGAGRAPMIRRGAGGVFSRSRS